MAERVSRPHKISNVTAGFMLAIAVIFDGIQGLLTLTIFGALFSWFFTFLALVIFGVWFAILGINYFSGRAAGLKIASVFGSAIAEMVPFINGLPAITAGVAGIIVSSRLEEKGAPRQAANDNAPHNHRNTA